MGDNCKTEKYSSKFLTPYYYNQNNPNNFCNGYFKLNKTNNKLGNLLLFTNNSIDRNNFGDISYPRTQNGRWNMSLSNTKLHPIISIEAITDASNNTIGYKTAAQSGNIFRNTHHNKSKKNMFSYLVNNKRHLNR
jgi:hypothetical protein